MLYTPKRNAGSSRYCGPTAIMAVTGLPGSDVVDAIRQVRGDIRNAAGAREGIMGVSNEDLLAAMGLLGWMVVESWQAPKGDAAFRLDPKGQWFGSRGERKSRLPNLRFSKFATEHGVGGPFIVNVTGHYMAVSQGEVWCAATTSLPRDISKFLAGRSRYRNAWVKNWWRFDRAIEAARTAPANRDAAQQAERS